MACSELHCLYGQFIVDTACVGWLNTILDIMSTINSFLHPHTVHVSSLLENAGFWWFHAGPILTLRGLPQSRGITADSSKEITQTSVASIFSCCTLLASIGEWVFLRLFSSVQFPTITRIPPRAPDCHKLV